MWALGNGGGLYRRGAHELKQNPLAQRMSWDRSNAGWVLMGWRGLSCDDCAVHLHEHVHTC